MFTADGALKTRYVAPDTFIMGSPFTESEREADEAQRQVTIKRGFHMMQIEVTQGLFHSLMRENPSFFQSCGQDCPVEMVTWYQAAAFANVLSEKQGLETCYEYQGRQIVWPRGLDCRGWRLPTEAEWEFAARGGESHTYSGSNDIDEVAWYGYSKSGKTPHKGCEKKPNAYGLCDMTGNVSEWVWDTYQTDQSTDSIGLKDSESGQQRGVRGGSWFDFPGFNRIADRAWLYPGEERNIVGIRLVRSGEP